MNPTDLASLLETDRIWAAYALADLDPPYAEAAEWRARPGGVVLAYRGFDPPVLFAHGDPAVVERLFEDVEAGVYQYALLGTHRALIRDRLRSSQEAHMWRMVLPPESFPGRPPGAVDRLSSSDLPELQRLLATADVLPDAFHPKQLEAGCFFGVWEGGTLAAVAGTHVLSLVRSVAAIGNVFTRQDRRGHGLAKRTTGAVAEALLRQAVQTIVLNVGMGNEAAVRAYRALGFMPFCGYYEGVGALSAYPATMEGNQHVGSV